jgi:hypothetical protein
MAISKTEIKDFVMKVIKQISGSLDEDETMVPEYGIQGTGILYCCEYGTRAFVKIARGQKAWVVDDEKDDLDRILIYTQCGKIVKINHEEIIYTEFD